MKNLASWLGLLTDWLTESTKFILLLFYYCTATTR
jgi:hypothetical protein